MVRPDKLTIYYKFWFKLTFPNTDIPFFVQSVNVACINILDCKLLQNYFVSKMKQVNLHEDETEV